MPTAKDGKICYVEMPATDVQASADFYQRAFGWTIRTRGDGAIAFDDTTGEVSGAFVLGRPPAAAPGMMVYIMVDSMADAIETVKAHGGEIVQPIGGDPGEMTARFRDPGGNVIGLYQEPGSSKSAARSADMLLLFNAFVVAPFRDRTETTPNLQQARAFTHKP